jgi:Acetyltransferase (GNAT) domain
VKDFDFPEQEKKRSVYRQFCAAAPDLPLFMHDWYLDAVCTDGAWSVALVEKAGRAVAAMPYFLKKRLHWHYVAMPLLARQMGPYLLPEFRNGPKENGLIEALLAQLPPLAAFEQDFNYTAANWLPFYWQGYRQTTRYSYTLALDDLQKAWQNLAPDYRNNKIPKAQARVHVYTGGGLLDFYKLHNQSFARQGQDPPFSYDFLKRLDEALGRRDRRALFFASDRATGALHATAYLVWDTHCAYYLLAGDDPALRSSGASVLIAWEAVRYAAEVLKLPVFEFMGSMIRPVERVRRQFGATQKPYFRVRKEWSWAWRLAKRARR